MKAIHLYNQNKSTQEASKKLLKSNKGQAFANDVDKMLSDLSKKYGTSKININGLLVSYLLCMRK